MTRLIALFSLWAILFAVALTQPKTIRVPQDHATIQAAIDAAVNGDTVLIAEGRYMVNLKLTKRIVLGGLYVLDGDTSHISKTILDGSAPVHPDSGSVIFVTGDADSTTVIEGLTITGGRGTLWVSPSNGSQWYFGGGILVRGYGARIRRNRIIANMVTSTPTVPNVRGGGIAGHYATTSTPLLIVEGNQISRNEITSSSSAEAAGLSVGMRARIVHNVIDANTATGGWLASVAGGIAVFAVSMNTVEIASNTIRGNVSSNHAGGLKIYPYSSSGGPTVIMTNNLVVGNSALRGGGAIDLGVSCSLTLVNNTIADNASSWGGGLRIWGTASNAPTVIGINNIFWNNSAAGGDINGGTFEILHNNLIRGESLLGDNNFSADPRFASDGSYALTAESPCIAAGTSTRNILGSLLTAPTDDLLGNARPATAPDLGAIESELASTTAQRPNRAEVRQFTAGAYAGRHYTVFRPKGMETEPDRPVILHLHGYDGTLDWDMNDYRIHLYGDSIGAVTVYPEALSRRWNSGLTEVLGDAWPTPSVDDVGFISMLIDTLHAQYQIDTTRVHVVGYSNGGFMVHRLAKVLSHRIASGVIVSGAMAPSVYSAPTPSRYVPLMIVHGTADPTVPFTAGAGRYGTEAEVEFWRTWNDAFGIVTTEALNPNSSDQSSVIRKQFYAGMDPLEHGSLRLVYYRIENGSHEWPNGGAYYGAPVINRDFNVMSDAIRFFMATRRLDASVSRNLFDFGNVLAAESDTTTIVITNWRRPTISVTSIVHQRPQYTVATTPALPVDLAAGASMQVRVIFQPDAAGQYPDTLAIVSSDTLLSNQRVVVLGGGVASVVKVATGGLYVLQAGGEDNILMRLSLPGLQATPLGSVGLSTLRTLAVNPQSRELVGVGVRSGVTSLYRVSADSGKAVRMRLLSASGFAGLAFGRGDTLYGATRSGEVYRIDQATGLCSRISPSMNDASYTAVAYDRQTGLLWLAGQIPKDSLYTLNPVTGVRTRVSSLPFNSPVVGMAFNAQNKLHAVIDNGSSEFYLVTINTVSYEATPVSDLPLPVTGLVGFAMDPDSVVTSVAGATSTPHSYGLEQNYPNPFNPATVISYTVVAPSELRASAASRGGAEGPARVRLSVYDLLGREVAVLVDGEKPEGVYTVRWDAAGKPSGVYFYTLRSGSFVETKRMILIR